MTNLDIAGTTMFVVGFLCESIADIQKFKFKANPTTKGRWCDSGKNEKKSGFLSSWGIFFETKLNFIIIVLL